MKWLRILVCVVLIAMAALAGVVAYARWGYTIVLERKDTMQFQVQETHRDKTTFVHLSGFSGDSAFCVKNVTTRREGNSVVVLVHLFSPRSGTTGSFDHVVDVPKDITDVKFGEKRVVIWKRL